MSDETDWHRITFLFFAAVTSVLAGYFGQPLIHGNEEAISVIVNVFSIMAGFLVAIMTILAEPALYRGGTWRSESVRRGNVYRRLARHKWLFILYLSTLGLVFVSTLLQGSLDNERIIIHIEQVYFGFAVFAFILSLALPSRLMKIQLERFDEYIESRKKE